MAKYNREFLVPYLQNVCALHLANNKIIDQSIRLQLKANGLENDIKRLKTPREPVMDDSFGIFFTIMGPITFVLGLIFRLMDILPLLSALFMISGITEFLVGIMLDQNTKAKNIEKIDAYNKQVEKYNELLQYYKDKRNKQLPAIQAELQLYIQERKKIEATLNRAYGVNIIPSHYRDIYAAVYLYDWFSTSRADDLDMALNMFVLEEIKEKLDAIIANQAEIILNQRMMLANQQRSLEQQQRHSNMMRAKLNQIAASNEERNVYLSMIESNTAATAYFAAADYIRKI